MLEQLMELLTWLWTLDGVRWITYTTLLSVGVAVAAALYTGDFKFNKLADFLAKKLAPYVIVYGFAKAFALGQNLEWVATAAFALIEAALIANIMENLALLGFPLPDPVLKLVKKTPSLD